jgi:hypothetical protein
MDKIKKSAGGEPCTRHPAHASGITCMPMTRNTPTCLVARGKLRSRIQCQGL